MREYGSECFHMIVNDPGLIDKIAIARDLVKAVRRDIVDAGRNGVLTYLTKEQRQDIYESLIEAETIIENVKDMIEIKI